MQYGSEVTAVFFWTHSFSISTSQLLLHHKAERPMDVPRNSTACFHKVYIIVYKGNLLLAYHYIFIKNMKI